jgi:hypothetical protein
VAVTLLEEFAQLAENLGLGTYPGTIFLTKMPTTPDECLVVGRYGGAESSLADNYDEPRIQYRCRGTAVDVRVAEALAERVYDAVNGLERFHLPGGTWLSLAVGLNGGPVYIGQDQNGRHEFTANFRVEISRTSTNRENP